MNNDERAFAICLMLVGGAFFGYVVLCRLCLCPHAVVPDPVFLICGSSYIVAVIGTLVLDSNKSEKRTTDQVW